MNKIGLILCHNYIKLMGIISDFIIDTVKNTNDLPIPEKVLLFQIQLLDRKGNLLDHIHILKIGLMETEGWLQGESRVAFLGDKILTLFYSLLCF